MFTLYSMFLNLSISNFKFDFLGLVDHLCTYKIGRIV